MLSNRIQALLISVYSVANAIGFTRYAFGQRIFSFFYCLYKRFLEDPHAQLIKKYPQLVKGGHLVDVGANIGYVSVELSKALEPGFKLFSFEPEANNFLILNNNLKNLPNRNSIFAFQHAVGESEREGKIALNKLHHGDHRLMSKINGQEQKSAALQNIQVVALDEFLDSLNALQPVVFVKIDVQGNESLVLEGMKRLISQNRKITLSLEVTKDDEETVKSLNSICGLDFNFFDVSKNGTITPISREELKFSSLQYRNILATRKLLD